jgi:hypothetical protein
MSANQKPQNFIDEATSKANEFIVVNIKTLEIENITTL